MSAVFDFEAIKKRFTDPFPEPIINTPISPRINGSGNYHCDICPLKPTDHCAIACSVHRGALTQKDGVNVSGG